MYTIEPGRQLETRAANFGWRRRRYRRPEQKGRQAWKARAHHGQV
jgi:hypothetical protein